MKYNTNLQKPIMQSNGYNGSEPTRESPHCLETKSLSRFGFRRMSKK